jgi:hypothetical protein
MYVLANGVVSSDRPTTTEAAAQMLRRSASGAAGAVVDRGERIELIPPDHFLSTYLPDSSNIEAGTGEARTRFTKEQSFTNATAAVRMSMIDAVARRRVLPQCVAPWSLPFESIPESALSDRITTPYNKSSRGKTRASSLVRRTCYRAKMVLR